MNKKILKLEKMVVQAELLIHEEQKKCSHDNVKVEYGSNTGNYDPYADCYWITVDCLDCGKYMYFDSKRNDKEYRYYSLKSRK